MFMARFLNLSSAGSAAVQRRSSRTLRWSLNMDATLELTHERVDDATLELTHERVGMDD